MGRYANTAVGELKLTIPVAHAVGHVVGDERGRDSVVVLTRAEVQEVIHTLRHFTTPEFEAKVQDIGLNLDTSYWYFSHLGTIPRRIKYLEDWLRLDEDSIVFG